MLPNVSRVPMPGMLPQLHGAFSQHMHEAQGGGPRTTSGMPDNNNDGPMHVHGVSADMIRHMRLGGHGHHTLQGPTPSALQTDHSQPSSSMPMLMPVGVAPPTPFHPGQLGVLPPDMPKPNMQFLAQRVQVNEPDGASRNRFACPFTGCGKLFAKPSALARHVRTHSGERPFVCDFDGCGQRFAERGNMERHKKVHTKERPYICAVDQCGRLFARRGHVQQHAKSQHPTVSEFQFVKHRKSKPSGWLIVKGVPPSELEDDENYPEDYVFTNVIIDGHTDGRITVGKAHKPSGLGSGRSAASGAPKRKGPDAVDSDHLSTIKHRKTQEQPQAFVPRLPPRMVHGSHATQQFPNIKHGDISISDYMRPRDGDAGRPSSDPLTLPPPPLDAPLPFNGDQQHPNFGLNDDADSDRMMAQAPAAAEPATSVSKTAVGQGKLQRGQVPTPENVMLPYERVSSYVFRVDGSRLRSKMKTSKRGACRGQCCMTLTSMGPFDVDKGCFDSPCLDRAGLVECGDSCPCATQGTRCFNRAISEGRRKILGTHIQEVPVYGLDPYTRVNIVKAADTGNQAALDGFIKTVLLPALNQEGVRPSHEFIPKPLSASSDDSMVDVHEPEPSMAARLEKMEKEITAAEDREVYVAARKRMDSVLEQLAKAPLMSPSPYFTFKKGRVNLTGRLLVDSYPTDPTPLPQSSTLPVPSPLATEAWVLMRLTLPAEMLFKAAHDVRQERILAIEEDDVEEDFDAHMPDDTKHETDSQSPNTQMAVAPVMGEAVEDAERRPAPLSTQGHVSEVVSVERDEADDQAPSPSPDLLSMPPVTPSEMLSLEGTHMQRALRFIIQQNQNNSDDVNASLYTQYAFSILRSMDALGTGEFLVEKKGAGVLCIDPAGIKANEFIWEYYGEIQPPWRWEEQQEAAQRLRKKRVHCPLYTMVLERHSDDAGGYDILYLDSTSRSSVASRISHSCDPNCATMVVAVQGQFVMAVYALRDIAPGEELTIDYCLVTESEELYQESVCLCGSSMCRFSHYYFTAGRSFQQLLNVNYSIVNRVSDLLLCSMPSHTSSPMVNTHILETHGIKSSVLEELPPWAIKFAALAVHFLEFELRKLPFELSKLSSQYTADTASSQAKGVFDIRLQNLIITLNKVSYFLRRSGGRSAPPPFRILTPTELEQRLWSAPDSVVKRLLWCVSQQNVPASSLKGIRDIIFSRSTSREPHMRLAFARRRMTELSAALWRLQSSKSAAHHAAGDLLYLYAHTRTFFVPTIHRSFVSPPIGDEILPESARNAAEPHSFAREYGPYYAWASLCYWFQQAVHDPCSKLEVDRQGCIELPLIESCYTAPGGSLSHPHTAKHRKEWIKKLGASPMTSDPWKDNIWKFSHDQPSAAAPLTQGRAVAFRNELSRTDPATDAFYSEIKQQHGSLSNCIPLESLGTEIAHPLCGSPMLDQSLRTYVQGLESVQLHDGASGGRLLNDILQDLLSRTPAVPLHSHTPGM